jgi:NADH pyrophosphatase NudC (nudix superfamily)
MEFNYCPNCAGELEQKQRNLRVCAKCGFHLYNNPAPTNAVILENSKGEILLVKRKHEPMKGYWDLAGGFVDLDETIEESIHREIKEELGIEVKNVRYFSSYYDRYEFKGINYHTICLVFTANMGNGKVVAGDDAEEVVFFPKDAVPYEKIAFKTLAQALKEYLKEA